MAQRRIGYRSHGGERLSEIGVGCYAVGGVYGPRDPEAFIGVLRRAYELGVTFFDTADVYGPGEEVLGRAVAPFRGEVWIATKVGASADGKPNCSRAHVLASCDKSLQRLGAERIDLYQIHMNDPHTPVAETVGALAELKAAGKIRHYGVGHLPLSRVAEYAETGHVFSLLTELSAVSRGALDAALPLCRQCGLALIAFSVTGRGLLTGKIGPRHPFAQDDIRRMDPLFQRERLASGLRIAQRFRQLGQKLDKTPVQVAIAWVLAQPGVTCALTGPSTIAHLEENLGGPGWAMDAPDVAALERLFADEDARLRREQVAGLRSILAGDGAPQELFVDLVYVLETLVELGLATEERILPAFQRLWALRAQPDAAALAGIRAELREAFLASLAG